MTVKDIKIKTNINGIRAVLGSAEVENELDRIARKIADKANTSAGIKPQGNLKGFVTNTRKGKYGRNYAVVSTGDRLARRKNAKHNTLLKAMNDAKEG